MIRHVQTRWLSIQKVILRIVEQLVNLKQYFLKFLPTQQGFNYKDGVGSTVRYQRIKALLQSASFPPYALFVINIAQELRKFILLFQRKEPLIHLLHPKMLELIQKLLMRFVKPEIFTKKKTNGLISASKLTEIDFTDSTFQKVNFLSLDKQSFETLGVSSIHTYVRVYVLHTSHFSETAYY